jgi:manganese-dependent inorganic pyrophosphatase
MPPTLAGVLLAGLLSDTLILTSPTTTSRDRQAAERLARWAFVGGSPLRPDNNLIQAVLSAGQDSIGSGGVSNDIKLC